MTEKIKVEVVGYHQADIDEVQAMLDSGEYELESRIGAVGSQFLKTDMAEADIVIVCLSSDFYAFLDRDDFVPPKRHRPAIYVTSDPSSKLRLWAFRHGATDFLVRPFGSTDLHYRIGRNLGLDALRFSKRVNETRMLEFLENLLARSVQSVQPVLDPTMPSGHFYPDVARFFGRTPCDADLLEQLANESILARKVADRVRLCPVCREMGINYREICPKCGSLDFSEAEIIHHFACGHVGPMERFRRGSVLECPKCSATLRHIGLDYEKPLMHFFCNRCEMVFSDAKIEAQCLWCGLNFAPEKTYAKTIYEYLVTPLAQQAVDERQIGGFNLASILRKSQTGLYTRRYLENQAEREFIRSLRTKRPFCLIALRVEDFEHIRTEHARRANEYINSVFSALSQNLRQSDLTCVWGTDLLVVLLPDTPGEGGSVAARRMNDTVRGLEFLYSIHEPRITVSLVAWAEGFSSHTEMLETAMKELNS
ncbi:MAG: diguanylate cyclase [Candidatus Sumerlaeota bacterium]|nr:diguanylate cyclase [Candidatus Sumerlaeota bacterium]